MSEPFALMRLLADRSLDPGLGIAGTVTVPIGSGNEGAFATALQADGKLVLVGESIDGTSDVVTAVRVHP